MLEEQRALLEAEAAAVKSAVLLLALP